MLSYGTVEAHTLELLKTFMQQDLLEVSRSRKELVEYEDSLKVFRDWYSVIKTSHNKRRAEGIQKGCKEAKGEIALQMKSAGMPVEKIAVTQVCR